jgi:outer membrane protein insertion porin family
MAKVYHGETLSFLYIPYGLCYKIGMMRLTLLSAGLFLLLALIQPPAAPAADFAGLTVTTITLKDDRGQPFPDQASLLPLVEVRPGDLFSRQAVRKGIGYLYLEGKFRDVRVDAFPEQGGVRLEYTLVPITIVDRIVLRGNHSLPDRVIRDSARGIEGRELREETFPDIRSKIQAVYQAQGFYNTRVNFRQAPADDPHRAVLFLYITEPKRTIIEGVTFKGNTVFTDKELLKVMRSRPGRPLLTNVLLEDDLEAIKKKYAAAGYPAASPGPVSMSFRDERAFLEIAGTEGPKVNVSFSGNHTFCAEQFPDLLTYDPDDPRPDAIMEEQCAEYFRDLLLIWTEHDVSDTVIESSVDKIRNEYRDRGFADVKVEVKRTERPGALDLAFSIQEGRTIAVDEVRVEGNSVFTAKEIKAMMATRESGWLRERPFREDVLEKDLDIIIDQYAAAGYLSAEVKQTVTRTKDGGRALIALKVAEGRQTLTGNISFEGNAALSAADLSAVLTMKPAAPFNDRLLEEDRYRVLSLYSTKGYLYARVEAEKTPAFPDEAAGRSARTGTAAVPEVMNIRFRVSEDQRVTIGKIILRGNVETRDSVILRELEPRTGEPYNYESILKSQQRVYRYGYFNLAKFEPVHPNEKEYVKDMLFTVEERPAGAVEFGVGYGTLDRLRGFVEVSHRNLWGTARYASLRLEASDILERAALTFQEPWFLGFRNLDSKYLLAWSDAKRINEETREVYYQTRKTTASYGVERSKDGLKVSLTYQFENVENYNVQPAAELSPDDSGRVLISSLSPAIILDKRDDPFNPHSGGIHGINVKEAMNFIGSKADFTKVTVQSTWYLPLAEHTITALSARAGMGWPHHETQEVPLHERFYLGGSTTVRGYTQDSVGPSNPDASGNLIPTGGSAMVQLNAELRLNTAEGGGVVFFTDAGNVWVDQTIRLHDLRASYGAGLRYHTPVGPLRIDYGLKIHRRPGESPGELHFNIGQAF